MSKQECVGARECIGFLRHSAKRRTEVADKRLGGIRWRKPAHVGGDGERGGVPDSPAVGHGRGGEKSGSRSGLPALRLAPGDFLGAHGRREAMRRWITRGRCSRPARGTDPSRAGHPLPLFRWVVPLADSVSPSFCVFFCILGRAFWCSCD